MEQPPFDPEAALAEHGMAMPPEIDMSGVFNTTESDPSGRDPHASGAKLDAGKVPLWHGVFQYFPNALKAVGFISEFGSRKYTWGGWKDVPEGYERYSSALGRHLLDEAGGELYDKDTNMLHAAQVAWNANARLELLLKEHPLHRPTD